MPLPGAKVGVEATVPGIGSPAPKFELPLAQGCRWQAPRMVPAKPEPARVPVATPKAQPGALRLADFCGAAGTSANGTRGGVTLLMFWAFWCDTWKDATRDFKKLRPQFDRAKVRVACVTVDASQQPVATGAFANGDIWYPVAIDRDSEVSMRYGVRRVPTIFVLDAAGIIRAHFEAFPGERRLMQAIHAAGKPFKSPPGSKQ